MKRGEWADIRRLDRSDTFEASKHKTHRHICGRKAGAAYRQGFGFRSETMKVVAGTACTCGWRGRGRGEGGARGGRGG